MPREVVVIRTQTFDVYAPSGEPLAVIAHNTFPLLQDRWVVSMPNGWKAGSARERVGIRTFLRLVPILGALLSDQTYDVMMDERRVAEVLQLGLGLHVTLRLDASLRDRRVVLAFCTLRALFHG